MRLPAVFRTVLLRPSQKNAGTYEKRNEVHETLLGLTLSNPCMITCGSEEYPNGAIKSVVFFPKEEYLGPASKICKRFIMRAHAHGTADIRVRAILMQSAFVLNT